MKVTICSDAHDNFSAFNLIKQRPIFFLGDVYNNQKLIDLFFGTVLKFYLNQANKKEVMDKFKTSIQKIKESIVERDIPEFFKQNEVYVLPGNHEDKQFYQRLINLPNIHNLHKQKIQLNNTEIAGHGGFFLPSGEMKIDNFFWLSDSEIAKNIQNLNLNQNCVIMMHELPLKNYCEETRTVIEKIKPKFVIGCHNHKDAGERKINGISYINCGALKYNKFKVMDL